MAGVATGVALHSSRIESLASVSSVTYEYLYYMRCVKDPLDFEPESTSLWSGEAHETLNTGDFYKVYNSPSEGWDGWSVQARIEGSGPLKHEIRLPGEGFTFTSRGAASLSDQSMVFPLGSWVLSPADRVHCAIGTDICTGTLRLGVNGIPWIELNPTAPTPVSNTIGASATAEFGMASVTIPLTATNRVTISGVGSIGVIPVLPTSWAQSGTTITVNLTLQWEIRIFRKRRVVGTTDWGLGLDCGPVNLVGVIQEIPGTLVPSP